MSTKKDQVFQALQTLDSRISGSFSGEKLGLMNHNATITAINNSLQSFKEEVGDIYADETIDYTQTPPNGTFQFPDDVIIDVAPEGIE